MSKLEEQKALPRRRLFGKKRVEKIWDLVINHSGGGEDIPPVKKRKAKKAKRK